MGPEKEDCFWQNTARIVFMAGNFTVRGNVTPAAEFNIFHDPVAAQIVLDSWRNANRRQEERVNNKGIHLNPIHFVPLDITERVVLDLDVFRKRQKLLRADARFLRYALNLYGRFHALACSHPGKSEVEYEKRAREVFKAQLLGSSGMKQWKPFCYMHDALAAWSLLSDAAFSSWDWAEDEVVIDTSAGQHRGQVLRVRSQAQPMSSAPPEFGTRVKWLRGEPWLLPSSIATEEPGQDERKRQQGTARGPEVADFLARMRQVLDCDDDIEKLIAKAE